MIRTEDYPENMENSIKQYKELLLRKLEVNTFFDVVVILATFSY